MSILDRSLGARGGCGYGSLRSVIGIPEFDNGKVKEVDQERLSTPSTNIISTNYDREKKKSMNE